nr:MAG: ORF1 [TTV-like mini virus]
MPYYNYWRRPYRRNYFRRRRPRRFVRRRFYRRKRYWVRKPKRKLKSLHLKEWQPLKINKLTVKGKYPLFLTTHYRIGHNLIQYIDSIAPTHYHGGGGFSILQFTLNGLYELFQKGQNIWTKSNCNLPLIRYLLCKLKFYKAEKYDYVVTIQRCYPMCCSDLMYMSTQPFVMMQTKGCIFVPCRQNSQRKKPFKKKTVLPPSQMTNHWYFQTDLSKTGLVLIKATACSLDRTYMSSKATSTTIGLTSLNTTTFQFHNWKDPPTGGYKPQDNLYFWGSKQPPESDPMSEMPKNLIYLGNTGPLTEGTEIGDKSKITTYTTQKTLWGNIFHPHWLSGDYVIYVTNKPLSEMSSLLTTNFDKKLKEWTTPTFTVRTLPLTTHCRYNPLADKGVGNKLYLVSNTLDNTTWSPPKNTKLIRKDFPLWILAWGWADWQKKLDEIHRFDTEYMTVIETKYIEPFLHYYVFLDDDFTLWPPKSPYGTDLTLSDSQNFFPKNNFQIMSLNEICSSGPGTIKLPTDHSAEAHLQYQFKFKLGGCPAPMETICNPIDQPKYPTPNNQLLPTSLQSPETPIQTYLYNFDERQGILTLPAAKRIRKDYATETIIFPPTGTTEMDVGPPPKEISIESPSSSEEEEETSVQQQLLHLRRKQLQLKRRILKLLKTPLTE